MLLPSIDALHWTRHKPERVRAREPLAHEHNLRDALRHSPPVQWLGPSEHMFVAMRKFTAANVTRVMALEGNLTPSEIRTAMRILQTRHPLLRARIVDGPRPYFVHGAAPAPEVHVVERRGDAHFQRVLEEVLDSQINPEHGPHFSAHYVYGKKTRRSELILAMDHSLCDGVSMNSLCHELLEILAQRPLQAAQPQLPVLAELLPEIEPWKQLSSFSYSFANFAYIGMRRALQGKRPAARTSSYLVTSFGKQETKALIERARSEGTTVTGALMAAAAITLREREGEASQLAISVPVNLRPRITHRALSARHLGNYTSVAYLRAQNQGSFWPLARDLKEKLETTVGGERFLAAVKLIYSSGRRLVRGGRPPLAHAMISNSGLVPLQRDYGAFEVRAFYSATSAPMLSADFSFFCNTFDGSLTVNLLFSEETVSRQSAAQILAKVRAQLVAP